MTDKPRSKFTVNTACSYSRLWTYIKDPQDYYLKYVIGVPFIPSEPMVKGSIFSEAYADPKFDWKAALINPRKVLDDDKIPETLTFTSDNVRIFERALSSKDLLRLPPKQCEQSVYVQSKICKLMMKNDGYNPETFLVVENKFGKPWDKERANTEDQMTFYAYCSYLQLGKIPLVRVQSINSKTGEVKVFEVQKTKQQFEPLEEKIEYAFKGILNEAYEKIV